MDFANDAEAVKQAYEFMFGKAFLVAPITEAGSIQREVYLPKAVDWYNFYTGERFSGGQTVKVEAPIDQIPLFVKAGSIMPLGPVVQYSDQDSNETLEICIYEGANGEFTLYEDEGDNYNYEDGKYSEITFVWNDDAKTLTINGRNGSYNGMNENRVFNIIKISDEFSVGTANRSDKKVKYNGAKTSIQL
ncbi:MAG TPA: glycoside hydrolase family 31 protein, partial [Prolixibacteraceae bacterium]|nr:glycoside hydrolase family 31 protein [Prolixibacteraceae bacterium]